jgi:hypothetical protein
MRPLTVHLRSAALALFAAAALTLLPGCQTSPAGGLFSWFTGRGERRVAAAEVKVEKAQADVLAAAQRNVEEFMAALPLAPAGRARDVALEAGRTAQGNLAQALGPLPPATAAQIGARAAALISEDPAARAAAERERAAERRQDAAAATRLADVSAELGAEREKNKAIAASNAELAAQAFRARWIQIGLASWAVLSTAAGLAWKMNLGGLQTGVAAGLAGLRDRYGVKDEDVLALEHAIDAPTAPRVQRGIAAQAKAAALALLAAKAEARVRSIPAA